jgi:1,4-dihydroxy-2-naphthoate octaprenyltransferase
MRLTILQDLQSDKINERKKLAVVGKIMGGVLDPKYWELFKILSFICILIVIITPIIFGNFLGLVCSILGLIIGIGYSLPPLRFKTRPFGDILACTLGFITLFTLRMTKNLNFEKFTTAFPYLGFSSLMAFAWSILCLGIDYKADKIAGHNTTSTKLNRNWTFIWASFGYFICGLILSFYFQSFWAVLLFLSSFIILFSLKYKSTNFAIFVLILVTSLSILAYSSIFIKFL